MKKTIRSFFTAALSLATLLITGSAWAATPVAVWDGDFSELSKTQGDITYTIKGDSIGTSVIGADSITIGDTPIFVERTNRNGSAYANYNKYMTVILRYSQYPVAVRDDAFALVSFEANYNNGSAVAENNQYRILSGVAGDTDRTVYDMWGNGAFTLKTQSSTAKFPEVGMIAAVYQSGTTPVVNVYLYNNTVDNHNSALGASNRTTCGFWLGGTKSGVANTTSVNSSYTFKSKAGTATGLVITGIAVFDTNLNSTDVAAFKWPTHWVGEDGANWSEEDNWSNGVPVANQVAVIPEGAVVSATDSVLNGVIVQGEGTIKYCFDHPNVGLRGDGYTSDPLANKLPSGLTDSANWTGTFWLRANAAPTTNQNCGWYLQNYGNANSMVRFSGICGFLCATGGAIGGSLTANLELSDDEFDYAWRAYSGSSSGRENITCLKGDGKIYSDSVTMAYAFADASEYSGSIQTTAASFLFGGTLSAADSSKKITIAASKEASIAAGKTWSSSGIVINGTLCGAGTLASATTFGEGAKIKPAVGGLKFGNTITGAVTIDCADIVAAGVNGSALITMTGASKTLPDYTLENATGYEAFAKDGVLYLVKSDAKEFYSHWENAPGILTWKSTQTITGGAKFSVFDITTCMDTTTEITDNVNSSVVPGYVGTSITPWHIFVKAGKGANSYKSPGYIIRLVPVAGSTVTELNGNFSPCNIGGLIVEEGASITSWTAGNASGRVGYFGDMDAQQPTWTYIGNNFTFQRSTLTFIGEVNLEIAEGKTFTSAYTTSLDTTKHTILRMIGAGTLNVTATGLNASGATLDFSRQSLSRQDTFILGGLTVDADTSFVFPADLGQNVPYKLCSGTLTAENGPHTVTVGGVSKLAQLTFNTTDKTVSYQWSDAKNEATLNGDDAWNNIQWKAGNFVHNADIELTLTKDVSITFTEALTFTKPIKILGGHTATFVCDGAIPTFVMDEEWNEIIHLKNLNFNNWDFSAYTHNGTPIKFTGVTGFGPKNTTGELTVEAILIDEGSLKAITVTDGYSDSAAFTFDKISGSGTFTFSKDTDKSPTPTYIFKDVSEFTGKFENTKGLKIVLGNGSGTGYTASAITYLADSKVKAGLGWSAPTAVFTDWMKVIGSVGDTLVTLESEPTALAMVTLLDESGTEKEGLFHLVYESGAVKIAEASEIVVDIANKKDMGAWTIEDPTELAGTGGVQASSLTLTAEAKLILDPTKTPVKLGSAPTFAEGAKLALSAAYKDCALGKFTLLTWTGAAIETEDIFDAESVSGACTLTCVDAPESGTKQLVLTVGDYANAKKIKVMPLGDSITEGTNQGQNFARPNYRIPLMQKLAANGFNVEALGYQKSCNADSANVLANPEYEWHCGMSGQMCRTQGAAGWEDSIDVALDMAGEPDIVTFKIGTNDLRGGVRDPEVLFEAWTNVIWKILKARPATRVICGSVIDARDDQTYNTTKVVEFNTKIADFIANGNFPGGRVYFANLNAACPPRDENGNDNGNLADALHPSWIGHDKMSDCWLAKIKEVMAIPFTPEAEIVYTTTTAIEDNIPQEYRNGFVKLATYTPTATKKHTSGTALTADDYDYYATDRAEEVFTKVGYYVVLKRQDTALVDYHDHVRFLWVDMAAFGDGTLADFGVPTVKKNQQIVDALHVYSNDTGIRKVEPTDNSAKGFVEFWPFSYGTTASDVEGAPAKLYGYDWNDLCSDSGVYGSMQVHRIFEQGESWNAGEVLFAYNRWTSNNNNEIGIGSFAQKMSSTTIDYTMTAGLEKVNAAAYEVMSIEIWGMPVAIEPTATQDTDTIEGCDVAVKYTLGTEAVGYDDWNVDFEVSSDVALGSDEFTLKGSNPLDGETMVDFPAFALEANTPVKLLATFAPQFKVTYAQLIDVTQTYTCGVVNNVKKDANVTVKIVISKEGEEDIVVDGSEFNTTLKADILPTAKVTPTTAEGYEAVVEFATDDIGAGYNDWNAKFILIPNVAIGEGEIKLGGSYAAYEEGKWIDLEFPACAANAEIDVLGLGGIENITVETVFNMIQSFKCGVKNIGLKNDATFTLKLVITDGETTKEICSIDNLKVEAKAIEPVDPEEPKSYDTEKEAQDAADKMNGEGDTIKPEYINAPDGIDKPTYAKLFTAVAEGNTVTVQLTTDAQGLIKNDLANAKNEATILTPDAEGKATIAAQPGLYYGIVAEGSLDAMATGKGQNWTMATDITVKVEVPVVKDAEGDKAKAAFFRPTCAVKDPTK